MWDLLKVKPCEKLFIPEKAAGVVKIFNNIRRKLWIETEVKSTFLELAYLILIRPNSKVLIINFLKFSRFYYLWEEEGSKWGTPNIWIDFKANKKL